MLLGACITWRELDFFFHWKSKLDFFQSFEITTNSQNFTGLPLSQSHSDHYEAACIFLISRVLGCFCLCGEIIEYP